MKTLADLFFALDAQLSAESRAQIVQVRENAMWKLHIGVCGLIKGLAFLRNPSSEGHAYFSEIGMQEEVSELLGEIYWRHLQSRDLREGAMALVLKEKLYARPERMMELAKDFARSYQDYLRRRYLRNASCI